MLRAWQQQLSGLKKILSHVKIVISLLETIEEFRDLTVLEWNFKEALTEKLKQLLEQQKIYWRQRGNIRWVKEGDAGTKLFYATATLKHRNNLIGQLQKHNGETVHNHPIT